MNLDSKSVRYRTVLSAWYQVQARNVPDHGTANGTGVLHTSVRVSWTVITRSGLPSETNGVSETGVTFFYTINSFCPCAGAFLVVFLFENMSVSLSCRSEINMKGGVLRSDFFQNDWNWLRGCANLCLEEIRPVEVLLLQKWRKKWLENVHCVGLTNFRWPWFTSCKCVSVTSRSINTFHPATWNFMYEITPIALFSAFYKSIIAIDAL